MQNSLKNCHKITINCKIGAVSRYPGLILGVASVVAAVPCLHGFNVQHRKLIAGFRDHDAVVGRDVVLGQRFEAVGQRPPHLEWQIPLADRARSRYRLVEIKFFLPEGKRNDLWQNLEKI